MSNFSQHINSFLINNLFEKNKNNYICKRINNEYNLNYKPIGTPLLKYKSF